MCVVKIEWAAIDGLNPVERKQNQVFVSISLSLYTRPIKVIADFKRMHFALYYAAAIYKYMKQMLLMMIPVILFFYFLFLFKYFFK